MLRHHLPLKFILEYFVPNSLHSKQYQSSDKTKINMCWQISLRMVENANKTFQWQHYLPSSVPQGTDNVHRVFPASIQTAQPHN